MARPKLTDITLAEQDKARFLANVPKEYGETDCWIWPKAIRGGGYGLFKAQSQNWAAHRISWSIFRGEIPQGLLVLHRCDCRSCFRPDHLFVGTYKDNTQDASAKGRLSHGPEHVARRIAAAPRGERWHSFKRNTLSGDDHPLRKNPSMRPAGSKNPYSKLTEDDVATMRLRRASGHRVVDIARDYPVGVDVVQKILSRKSWKHVP